MTKKISKRGRPRLGSKRMVTVGVRIEPTERDRLEAMAQVRGLSLCAYLRDLVRHELGENQTSGSPVRACV